MAGTTGSDMILTSLVLPPHSNYTPPPTQIQFGYSYLSQMSYIAVNSLKIKRSSTGYQEKENECIFNFNHKTSHRFHTSHNITTMAIKYILSLLLRLSCWFSFWIMVCMYDWIWPRAMDLFPWVGFLADSCLVWVWVVTGDWY